MNFRLAFIPLIFTTLITSNVFARDDALMLPIADAMNAAAAQEQLNQGIKFFFNKSGGTAKQKYGTFTSNKKTNAFNKSDVEACNWVFLSAMVALQQRAIREGGDAVVDIHSYYKKNEMRSDDNFECHAGKIMAGVALRGTVVKLK